MPALLGLGLVLPAKAAERRIIPSPQFLEWKDGSLQLSAQAEERGALFHCADCSEQERLAAEILAAEARDSAGGQWVIVPIGDKGSVSKQTPRIFMVDWSAKTLLKQQVADLLDPEDLRVLADDRGEGQAYVVKVDLPTRRVALVGSGPVGVLYAVSSLRQAWESGRNSLAIPAVHIRDHPDFRYRAASDWLVDGEINRWAYDYGDGRRRFVQRIKNKLDFCLQYKINMVFFDGFGWNSERFPGYSAMMRELNAYARARGIKLVFGGYGANYRASAVRPEKNIGRVWLNQDRYTEKYVHDEPAVKTLYACFGEDNTLGPYLGGCRGNEELNRLKAEEMRAFVRAVEPGALYIHHEDRGVSEPDGELVRTWKRRCERCRQKWPNDDVLAADGGAGAVAHGYANLLKAIRSVRNPETGYDAARDCTVFLTSPAYGPFSTIPKNWEDHLTFWENVLSQLPSDPHFQICFREVFPQEATGKRWIDAYRDRMRKRNLSDRIFQFYIGGADFYSNNYPWVATPITNGIFLDAETIYNFSGAVHQEPMQVLNSEFSWNVRAPGSRIPKSYHEAIALHSALPRNEEVPPEIDGPSGLLERACRMIYGDKAGVPMLRYFTYFRPQPRVGSGREPSLLVPGFPERIYAWAVLGPDLLQDQSYWTLGSVSPKTLKDLDITETQWQDRLARYWRLRAEVNADAIALVSEALFSWDERWLVGDARQQERQDVEYLRRCLRAGKLFAELLSEYHALLASVAGSKPDAETRLTSSRDKYEGLTRYLSSEFSFYFVDPLGGDQATWLDAFARLRGNLADVRDELAR